MLTTFKRTPHLIDFNTYSTYLAKSNAVNPLCHATLHTHLRFKDMTHKQVGCREVVSMAAF